MADGAHERINGQAWTIRQVFSGRRYGLDNYQREFAWESSHLKELLTDLSERFLDRWQPEHDPSEVPHYQPYFLGPIVTHVRQTNSLIVDGQQRLTVLMLLLIWLERTQADRDDAVSGLGPLIVFDLFGHRRFAVEPEHDYDERRRCLTALMAGEEVDSSQLTSRSNRTLVRRYNDFEDLFPEALRGDALPAFIYWLLDRVYLVEISTGSGPLALETFETMNDRGLRLNSLDLLKSFVLSKIGVADQPGVNRTWRARIAALTDADSNAHVGFMRNWMRAKYSRGPIDDAGISRSFDKWVRREHHNLGLRYPGDFLTFVNEMDGLSRRYVELIAATKEPCPGLDVLYANGRNTVTLQLPLILAALSLDDDRATFERKARMIGGYLDIVVARRMVNWRDYGYDALSNGVFSLAREIRGLDIDTLAKRLGEEIATLPETFDAVGTYGLRARNRTRVRYLLARMTAWLELQHEELTTTPAYGPLLRKLMSYDIEHIWADKPELQPEVQARRFDHVRNSFGGLLLLPKSFNRAYGAKPYAVKVKQYWGQGTLLAKSLHPDCYTMNPGFDRVRERYALPFTPYPSAFDERAIMQRQALYQRLCELVWDPAQYGLSVPATTGRRPAERKRAHFGITIMNLVEGGFMPPQAALVGTFQDLDYHARVTADGQLRLDSGEVFDSPSSAAGAALNRSSWNGWTFWRVVLPDGSTPELNAIRATALKAGFTAS